ncbi:MAG: DUF1294 domain-containing protein [Parasphingorhabdus sp.]|uniref:DUF1294 domain-containing protein n=1 Tax=Parasphingorhabdus sp. TaxID=2709688 RepID=UPI00300277F7
MVTSANILLALLLINVWTFCMFGWDKVRAESGGWRVAESSLLGLAFIGGTAGAYAGRAVFRHKTRKQPFCDRLQNIVMFQGVVLFGGAVYFLA